MQCRRYIDHFPFRSTGENTVLLILVGFELLLQSELELGESFNGLLLIFPLGFNIFTLDDCVLVLLELSWLEV